jgi:hypothetical protein
MAARQNVSDNERVKRHIESIDEELLALERLEEIVDIVDEIIDRDIEFRALDLWVHKRSI